MNFLKWIRVRSTQCVSQEGGVDSTEEETELLTRTNCCDCRSRGRPPWRHSTLMEDTLLNRSLRCRTRRSINWTLIYPLKSNSF